MSLPRIPADLRGRELWLMLARDQFGRKLSAEVDSMLLDTFKDVVRRILVDGRNLSPRQNDRLAELFRSTSAMLADKYGSVSSTVTAALGEFSGIEAAIARQEFQLRVGSIGGLAAEFRGLSPDRVLAIADVLVEGQRLPDWWRDQARRMSGQVRRQMQIGLTLGESVSDIVKRIVPPRGSVEPSVYRRAKREATTLVRTASTAVSAQARLEELRRMDPKISDRYILVAVRDARTTEICRALDGREFRYDDPKALLPPFHFQCRTSLSPVINRKGLGISEPYEAGPGGWKDYDAWLRAQPEDVQRKILGAGRWDLWRSGKVSLQDMIDSDRRTLTLEQLRALALSKAPDPNAKAALATRVDVVGPTDFRADVDTVMAGINRVHSVPATVAPVHIRHSPGAKVSHRAEYQFLPNTVRVFDDNDRIGLLVHELGHVLDAKAFGSPGAKPTERPHLSGKSVQPPEWRALWKAIKATRHYAAWEARVRRPDDFASYMTKPAELFARAYEQWIFQQLPDTDPLQKALRSHIKHQLADEWMWEDSDFRDVAKAMDAIFQAVGWLRSTP